MASRGSTFAKQDRDRAKKARAQEKQAKRAERARAAEEVPTELPEEGEIAPEVLLKLVEELHQDFADERISFEEFEERKAELMARISV